MSYKKLKSNRVTITSKRSVIDYIKLVIKGLIMN